MGFSQGPQGGASESPPFADALGWVVGKGAVCLGTSQVRAAPSQGCLCAEGAYAPTQEEDFLCIVPPSHLMLSAPESSADQLPALPSCPGLWAEGVELRGAGGGGWFLAWGLLCLLRTKRVWGGRAQAQTGGGPGGFLGLASPS